MSESKHTLEPWEVFHGDGPIDCPGIDAGDLSIVVFGERLTGDFGVQGHTVDEAHANARRIVAAVNATSGISTEALEAGVVAEMVEVLHAIRNPDASSPDKFPDLKSIYDIADELIAKIGGAA